MYGPDVEQQFALAQFERDRLVNKLTRFAEFQSNLVESDKTPAESRFEQLKEAVNRLLSPSRLQRRPAAQ